MRIRFDFGSLTLDAETLDTPTAKAIAAALPMTGFGADLGRGSLFRNSRCKVAREKDARAVVTPGEIAYWPDGHAIAIGFGRTPISQGDETRLASPCNIWAKALGDVKTLAKVRGGTKIKVTRVIAASAKLSVARCGCLHALADGLRRDCPARQRQHQIPGVADIDHEQKERRAGQYDRGPPAFRRPVSSSHDRDQSGGIGERAAPRRSRGGRRDRKASAACTRTQMTIE